MRNKFKLAFLVLFLMFFIAPVPVHAEEVRSLEWPPVKDIAKDKQYFIYDNGTDVYLYVSDSGGMKASFYQDQFVKSVSVNPGKYTTAYKLKDKSWVFNGSTNNNYDVIIDLTKRVTVYSNALTLDDLKKAYDYGMTHYDHVDGIFSNLTFHLPLASVEDFQDLTKGAIQVTIIVASLMGLLVGLVVSLGILVRHFRQLLTRF